MVLALAGLSTMTSWKPSLDAAVRAGSGRTTARVRFAAVRAGSGRPTARVRFAAGVFAMLYPVGGLWPRVCWMVNERQNRTDKGHRDWRKSVLRYNRQLIQTPYSVTLPSLSLSSLVGSAVRE